MPALLVLTLWFSIVGVFSGAALGDDGDGELRKPASWHSPEIEGVVEGFGSWLTLKTDSQSVRKKTTGFLRMNLQKLTLSQRLDVIVNGISMVRPDVEQFVQRLGEREHASGDANSAGIKIGDFQYDLDAVVENEFVRNHVRLFYGRWLAQNHFYDESLEQLSQVPVESVLDPATLLYYRGLMQHQLLLKDECLVTAKKLLENEDEIPRRYAVIGRLMVADIEPLEEDSLDEISRLMSDVGRRTGLNRTGSRVIEEEQKVIEKLDKLIENLEQQQQQSKSKSRGGGQAPTGPIQASQVAGGGASGETDNKRQKDGGDWGDLPPAQRAAAMAEMAKDMPPHYRAVIEEYFRRLAEN
jgi:hypothetical protein